MIRGNARQGREKQRAQVTRRTDSRGPHRELSGLGLRCLHEFPHRFHRQRGMYDEDAGRGCYLRDRREIVDRVVRQLWIQSRVDRVAAAHQNDRVAVRRGLRRDVGPDRAASPGAVVGDDFLGLVELAGAALRIAAAQVAGRQHGLHAGVPEHRLRGQPHLREQAF